MLRLRSLFILADKGFGTVKLGKLEQHHLPEDMLEESL
jgi:hypothetical protein